MIFLSHSDALAEISNFFQNAPIKNGCIVLRKEPRRYSTVENRAYLQITIILFSITATKL